MVECIFGWGKQHGTMRKTKHRGLDRVGVDFMLNLIAYNLIRIPKLVPLEEPNQNQLLSRDQFNDNVPVEQQRRGSISVFSADC